MYTPIYFIIKKGATFDVNEIVTSHRIARVDWVGLANGDVLHKAVAKTADVRKILEKQEGITVLPALHRPIQAHHAKAFSHINAQPGEIAYDICERLLDFHGAQWLHPEEFFL